MKMASSSSPDEPSQGQSLDTSMQIPVEQPATAPAPVVQVDDGSTVGVGRSSAEKVGEIRQVPQAIESLSERRLRRIREAEENLRKARARAKRAQAADTQTALLESIKALKAYARSLPKDAKFTLEVLLRFGAKAESVGATPSELFKVLEDISKTRASTGDDK